jgi:hypothetical protein
MTAMLHRSVACPGCGLVLPACSGPTHAYVGASPACWEVYQSVSRGREASEGGNRLQRLMKDTYAAQHPGAHDRRALQSVAVHLMGLCVLLERDGENRRLTPVLGRMPPRRTLDLHWLAPPRPNGRVTVADVVAEGAGRGASVQRWAEDVWRAWAPHHATIRGWLDGAAKPAG